MRDVSFILLAGGHSFRMGRDKAQLCWQGKTFLQHQAEKAQALGVGEILVSGYRGGDCPGGWCPGCLPGAGAFGRSARLLPGGGTSVVPGAQRGRALGERRDPVPGWCRPSAARAGTRCWLAAMASGNH